MGTYDFYILEGKKVRKCASVHEYAECVTDPKIKWTKVLDKIVSTIFLGFDHRMFPDNGKEPILFETMVFPDRTYARYQTYDEAINGHDKIVKKIRSEGGRNASATH